MFSKRDQHSHDPEESKQNTPRVGTRTSAAASGQQIGSRGPRYTTELDRRSLRPDNILQLQRAIGNQAVGRLSTGTEQSPIIRKKQNETGLPDMLKEEAERLSGHLLDDVRVHYNSAKPAQVQANAYAQGTDIHLAPGQEQHLPHEVWHVVQQKQGRVKPTMQLEGSVTLNDDERLEQEADAMGAQALTPTVQRKAIPNVNSTTMPSNQPLQLVETEVEPLPDRDKPKLLEGATPLFFDHIPFKHPEYKEYAQLMDAAGFPQEITDRTWTLLLKGFREQDFIQHQLEQLQYGEEVELDQDLRNIIRNDNICFQEVATIMADYLSVGNAPLALWSGGVALSDYAHQRGFAPLEHTILGAVVHKINFHQQWVLQAPLWNILSTVFVRQQPPSVHVFLRTFEADAVLFRQEVPVIREIFPNIPIYWHAIYTLEDKSLREINDNLVLVEEWQGFASQDQCVHALLAFILDHPNSQTEIGLDTALNNLPAQPVDEL